MEQIRNTYRDLADIAAVAVAIEKGFELLGVSQGLNGKIYFRFVDSEQLLETIKDFYAGKATGNLRNFVEAQRRVRDLRTLNDSTDMEARNGHHARR